MAPAAWCWISDGIALVPRRAASCCWGLRSHRRRSVLNSRALVRGAPERIRD